MNRVTFLLLVIFLCVIFISLVVNLEGCENKAFEYYTPYERKQNELMEKQIKVLEIIADSLEKHENK